MPNKFRAKMHEKSCFSSCDVFISLPEPWWQYALQHDAIDGVQRMLLASNEKFVNHYCW